MTFGNPIGVLSLLKRELVRTFAVINQVIWPPIITTLLYVLVFGLALGSRINEVDGVPYAAFLIPGLIMLQVIDSSYGETSSSVFQNRFLNSIQEILIAPLSALEIVTGIVASSVIRALGLALVVLGVSAVFVHALPRDWALFALVVVLVAAMFSGLGIIFGLLAEKFDHVAVLTTFVITPLTFVGGVFTSLRFLPPAVARVSLLNPMFYMIDAFRYAFSGRGDEPLAVSLGVVAGLCTACLAVALAMTHAGTKLRV